MTKAEFEQLLKAVTPPGAPAMPANRRRDAATQLAQLLTVAAAAEKSGVENTPEGRELLRIARLQALGNAYVRQLQQKSKPTDAEIEAYYNANSEKFQQASVQQLFVPTLKPGATNPPSAPDEAAQKARAEKFRERAIAGEPFDKLEKEAIEGTAYQNPPQVDLTFQRETLPPARQSVFNLKDGEFSPVMIEPAGAVVYKMISKKTLTLSEVKERISQRLSQEKFQSAMEALTKSSTPVLNDGYFGPPPAPPTLPAVSPARPSPANVPAQSPKQPQ